MPRKWVEATLTLTLMNYGHRVLGLLSLLSIITYLDRIGIAVAGPRMPDELHISPQAWGWVTGIFALSYALLEIPSGALGGRLAPRRVLTRIVLWWSAFTSLTGAVSNYILLPLTRFCFGIGEAGAHRNAAAVTARWIPARQRVCLGHRVDDQPTRRGDISIIGSANSDALCVEGLIFHLRHSRR